MCRRVIFQMNRVVTFQTATKLPLTSRLRALPLLIHFLSKFLAPIVRKFNSLFIRLFRTELQRKTESVVQSEQFFTSQAIINVALHLPQTFSQSLAKSFFFLNEDSNYIVAIILHLWKIGFVQISNRRHNFLQEILLDPQIKTIANRPTEQTTHYIALLFITWHTPINRHKRRSPQMISNHSHTFGM